MVLGDQYAVGIEEERMIGGLLDDPAHGNSWMTFREIGPKPGMVVGHSEDDRRQAGQKHRQ